MAIREDLVASAVSLRVYFHEVITDKLLGYM